MIDIFVQPFNLTLNPAWKFDLNTILDHQEGQASQKTVYSPGTRGGYIDMRHNPRSFT